MLVSCVLISSKCYYDSCLWSIYYVFISNIIDSCVQTAKGTDYRLVYVFRSNILCHYIKLFYDIQGAFNKFVELPRVRCLIDSIDWSHWLLHNINLALSSHKMLTSLVHHVTSYYCLKVVTLWTLPNQQFGGKFELPFETRFVKFDIT